MHSNRSFKLIAVVVVLVLMAGAGLVKSFLNRSPGRARQAAQVQSVAPATSPVPAQAEPAAPETGVVPATMAAEAAVTSGSAPTSDTAAVISDESIAEYVGKKFVSGPTRGKKIALTFDDGPSPKLTPVVLDILKKEGIHATFFMLGGQVRENPELARRVAEAGHDIGCHTTLHKRLPRMSAEAIQDEVIGTANFIKEVTGQSPRFFRPPYGLYNSTVLKACTDGGMVMVLWSVDTNDWKPKVTPASVQATCLRDTQGGAVILMHDIHAKSVMVLPSVIKELKAKGFEFVKMSELVSETIKNKIEPAADGGEAGAEQLIARPVNIPLNQSALR